MSIIPSRRRRSSFVLTTVALALVATACGFGSDDPSSSGAGADEPSTDAAPTEEPADAPISEEASGDDTAPDDENVSPTETDEPFDLSGGVVSSSEGRLDPDDPARTSFQEGVADATSPWPTDWSLRTAELGDFVLGLPMIDPRDGIAPLDTPKFESIGDATWLDDRSPGALVRFDDEARFYPLSILNRHEVVNDRIGDVPVAVTYCPLCNTAVAFDRRVDGQVLRFGVSGLLRNSDLVMWDDLTTSLWQQITGEGVVGEFAGTDLATIPTSIVSYGEARDAFPEARSLSRDTGRETAYLRNPYEGYSSRPLPFGYDGEPDPRYPALSRVVGVTVDGANTAYPFGTISEERAVNDEVGSTPVVVLWGGDTADALDTSAIADGQAVGTGVAYDRRVGDQVLTFTPADDDRFVDDETNSTWNLLGQAISGPLAGEELAPAAHTNEFWFAWAAFFPDGTVYEGG